MSISILVTLIQNGGSFDEVKTTLLVAKLPSPLAGACLSQQQALELWGHIQPELACRDLTDTLDNYKLQLLFLVDGIPTFQQTWSNWPCAVEGETSLNLPSGGKLWITISWDAAVKTVTLEQ
jgi:hypothetical protein